MADVVIRFLGDPHDAENAARAVTQALKGLEAEHKDVAAAADKTTREEKELAAAADRSHRSLSQATRGAIAGSGAYRHLGRSVAFASAAFLGTAGFVHVIERSISGASDLREQVEKVHDVFQESGSDVEEWAKGLATSFGIAEREADSMASTFGNMLVPMGIAPGKAAEMSKQLVELSADVGAFNNLPLADVLEKMRAGLAGMPRPLRTVGVFLDQNRIKAEAYSSGLVKATVSSQKVADAQTNVAVKQALLTAALDKYGPKTTQVAQATLAFHKAQSQLGAALGGTIPELTRQQKTMATYQIILKDTSIQHGNFAKTSKDLAQQQKILTAEISNLEDKLGEALLPTVTKIVTAMTDWLSKTENQERLQRDFHDAAKLVNQALHAMWEVLKVLNDAWKVFADSVGGAENAIKLLIGLKVASVLYGWVAALGMQQGLAGGAVLATGKVNLLKGALASLPGQVFVAVTLLIAAKQVGDWLHSKGVDTHIPGVERVTQDYRTAMAHGAGGYYNRAGVELVYLGGAGDNAVWYDPAAPAGGDVFYRSDSKGAPLIGGLSEKQAAGELGMSVAGLHRRIAWAMGHMKRIKAKAVAEAKGADTGAAGRVFPAGAGVNTRGGIPEQNVVTVPTTDTHGPRLLSAFGSDRGPNLDFMRLPGTVVGAPVDGTIARLSGRPWSAGWSRGAGSAIGLSIYIAGADGYMYYLTHFSAVYVKPGQKVSRGTPLGVVGDMGKASHIHIERSGSPTVTPGTGGTTGSTVPTTTDDLTVGTTPTAAEKPDIAKVPAAIDLRITRAERTKTLADDISAQQSLLAVYTKRLSKKGLSADEKSALRQAIEETKNKIADIDGEIAKAIADAHEDARKRFADWVKNHPLAATEQFASVGTTRGGDLVPGLRRAQAQVRQALEAAKDEASAALGQGGVFSDILSGFDQQATFTQTDEFGRTITHSIGEVIDEVNGLMDDLREAYESGSEKSIRAAVKAWEEYGPMVSAAVEAGNAQIQATAEKTQAGFMTAFGRVSSRILTAFDRETQRHLSEMQRDFQQQTDALQRELQARIASMQKALQAKIAGVEAAGAAPTPAEAQLAALQEAHAVQAAAEDLADAQKALQEAQATGDTQQIAAAQRALDNVLYQQRIDALQKIADAERKARDADTQAQVEKMQEEESALEQQLQDELALKIQALQDAESAREQDYQDQRDAQRTALEDQLTDWGENLQNKTATMEEFIQWLSGEMKPGGLLQGVSIPDPVAAMENAGESQGSAFANAFIDEIQKAIDKYNELLELISSGGGAVPLPDTPTPGGHYATGGIVPGPGGTDTVTAHVSPGELILTKAMQTNLAGQLMGGTSTVVVQFPGLVALGRDSDVGERLARVAEPALRRLITMKQ